MKTRNIREVKVGDRRKERDAIANELANIVGISFFVGVLLFILNA